MGAYMSAIRTGPWFIDFDGKTLLTWRCFGFKGTIILSDGRKLEQSQYLGDGEFAGRTFAAHPEHNPLIGKDSDGVYFWAASGRSFKAARGGE